MSAIFGIWHLDGRPMTRAELMCMSDVLEHRGPDGGRIWTEDSVGLGHRVFHTTPESLRESQPLVAGNGEIVLTADARIDNRQELIGELGLGVGRVSEITDAEVIAAAYERWGESCAERLIGDFAFAIWDGRRRTLFCARDHFGVKPLYYFHKPGHLFAFASEIKALLTLKEVPDEVDEFQVARHLMVPVPDDLGSTYYRHIKDFPPARAESSEPARTRPPVVRARIQSIPQHP